MKYGKMIIFEGNKAEQIKFLANAVSNDETRYFMKYIHVEQSEKEGGGLLAVSTDGWHLHLIDPLESAFEKVFGLTPGYWEVFKGSKRGSLIIARLEDEETKNWQYPNWRKVFPTDDIVYTTTFRGFTFKKTCIRHNYSELAKFIHDFPDATAIDLKYLESLGTVFDWNVEWRGASKALKFISNCRTALIMPMQIA
jgi:hypothetical protein